MNSETAKTEAQPVGGDSTFDSTRKGQSHGRLDGQEPPIVFFDGVCGLCNKFVDFLLRHDRQAVLRFAALQGETARRLLSDTDARSLDTMMYVDRRGTFRRSAAVVRILRHLGGVWAIGGGILWIVPLPLRDIGYRFVALMRYRVFGKRETCRLPSTDERERFLL